MGYLSTYAPRKRRFQEGGMMEPGMEEGAPAGPEAGMEGGAPAGPDA